MSPKSHPTGWPKFPFEASQRLARVQRHLEQDLAGPFSASEAARLASLHPAYFSTFFRRRVGITFSQWVRLVRVAKALELLEDTNLSVERVADICGLGTARSLQRAVRQITGTTPTQHRARHRKALKHK